MNSDQGKNRNSIQKNEKTLIVGIDLSLSRKTSICFYPWGKKNVSIEKAFGEDELISSIISKRKEADHILVVIDAPLSSLETHGFRDIDRIALSLGCRVLPISTVPMRKLAESGNRISKKIRKQIKNVTVVETHPWSVAKLLGFSNTEEMAFKIFGMSFKGDDADAVACCVAGIMFLLGQITVILSEDNDDVFIIPKVEK